MSRHAPPRKKDWQPGKTQVGVFVRTPEGATVYITLNDTPDTVMAPIAKAIYEMIKIHGAQPHD